MSTKSGMPERKRFRRYEDNDVSMYPAMNMLDVSMHPAMNILGTMLDDSMYPAMNNAITHSRNNAG
eukprot:2621132-Amphidinium_carterae.2